MDDHTAHRYAGPWPFLVGFGIALFLPWAFVLQFVYGQGLAAIVVLALASVMLFVGMIGWVSGSIGVGKDESWAPLAMLMFIGAEIISIFGLMAAYWAARFNSDVWPPEGSPDVSAPFIATVILIVSSFTVAVVRKKGPNANAATFANIMLLTIVIWIGFGAMTMMSWIEISGAGFNIDSNAFTTAMYGLTGIHFAHIVFGVLILLLALPPAFKGCLSFSYTQSITMYIHFVNIFGVWVLLQVYVW